MMIFCLSKSRSGASRKFSATVLPVTVMQSPLQQTRYNRYFVIIIIIIIIIICNNNRISRQEHIDGGLPSEVFAAGFKSASTGILFADGLEVVLSRSRSTLLAMAIKCNTALVLPPNTITTVMAFSKALPGHDIPGLIFFQDCLNGFPIAAHSFVSLHSARDWKRSREAQTNCFNSAGHSVGSVHAATGTCARAGMLHDSFKICFAKLPAIFCPQCFKGRLQYSGLRLYNDPAQ